LWILLLILVASQSAFAQTVVGRISGTVQDANGAGVPNASVKVINTANNSERTVTSDENGFYTDHKPAGRRLHDRSRGEGLQESTRLGQSVTADARLTVDLKLGSR
jgi:hypothetical protein